MSKISQEKKAAKAAGKELKGKQKKIAKSEAAKTEDKQPKQKTAISGIPNINKCCTCKHFPVKLHGETQPCKISGKYVARKAEFPCYKCKFEF